MNVELIEVKVLPEKCGRALKALGAVRWNEILIRCFRVIRTENKTFVDYPTVTWRENGEIKRTPLLTLPPEVKSEVDRVVLTAYWDEMKRKERWLAGERGQSVSLLPELAS